MALLINDPDLGDRYREAIGDAGFTPVDLPDNVDVSALVGCAAVVATSVRSSWNVSERLHTAGAAVSRANPRDDARVLAWLSVIQGRDVPAFLGCLALQLLWSMRGGQLSTHIEGHCVAEDPAATVGKTVQLLPGGLLHDVTGALTLSVQCAHQQAPGAWLPAPGVKERYRPKVTGDAAGVTEVVEAHRLFGVSFELIEEPDLLGEVLKEFVRRSA